MPKFRALGQRFSVASDDFFVSALIGLSNRVCFLAVAGVYVGIFADESILGECALGSVTQEDEARTLVMGALGFFALSFCMYASMLFVATRGTPLQTRKRHAMSVVLVAFVLLWLAEIAVAALVSELTARWPSEDDFGGGVVTLPVGADACLDLLDAKFVALVVAATLLWADVVTHAISAYVFLHRYDAVARASDVRLDGRDRAAAEWEGCFRVWCGALRIFTCGMFGFVTRGDESGDMYQSVAAVFSTWFEDTGLTLTDLATALILVRAEQKHSKASAMKFLRYDPSKSELVPGAKSAQPKRFNTAASSVRVLGRAQNADTAQVAPASPDTDEDVEEAAAAAGAANAPSPEEALAQFQRMYSFVPYMVAMYGWKLVMYAHAVRLKPLAGLRSLLKMPARRLGDGDNLCGCSQQALLGQVDIGADDVIYATFSSVAARSGGAVVQIPHAVMVDHAKRAVVVAMRGTLSLQDLMTDAMVEPASLAKAGRAWGFDGSAHHAHEGFLRVAMRIRAVLEHSQVLHRLLGVAPQSFTEYSHDKEDGMDAAAHVDLDALPDCTGYELVVLGHSLGAAVGALVTLMLRPSFPQASCLAFACPGTVMSYELAEQSAQWCSNVYLGDDVVPQLSWRSLTRLRDEALNALFRAKVSKARILRSAFWSEPVENLLYATDAQVPADPQREAMRAVQESLRVRPKESRLEQIPLYSCGVLIHMAKAETARVPGMCRGTSRKVRVYEPHWVMDRRATETPTISTRSLFDHFPDLVPAAMKDILDRYEKPQRKPTL